MHSKAYILGFICGLLAVAAVGLLLHFIHKKKNNGRTEEYDERQMAVRGKGFQLAYFTALIVLIIGGIAEMITGRSWCDLFTFAIIALWLSICVFVTYCAIKDAYFALRSRRKPLIIIMLAAGVINLVIGWMHPVWENGMLTTGSVNLITGICCIYQGAMLLVHMLAERRQENDE